MQRSSSNCDFHQAHRVKLASSPVELPPKPILPRREFGSSPTIYDVRAAVTDWSQEKGQKQPSRQQHDKRSLYINVGRLAAKSVEAKSSSRMSNTLGSMREKAKTNRTKSAAAESSILKKFLGRDYGKHDRPDASPLTASSTECRDEEKLRRKIFAHFDCQSISADYTQLLVDHSEFRFRSSSVGACEDPDPPRSRSQSKLLAQKSFESETPPEPEDFGDGKSNELVLSCPNFRNETGGEAVLSISVSLSASNERRPCIAAHDNLSIRTPAAADACVLENLADIYLGGKLCAAREPQLVIEHSDQGAFYYRHCFYGKPHQNYIGIDEALGPCALSIIRDRVDFHDAASTTLMSLPIYRVILRLSDLTTYRGSILEESLPWSYSLDDRSLASPEIPHHSGERCLPAKELLEVLIPDFQFSCLKLAVPTPKTEELIMSLDEQCINVKYKVGVLLCRSGQSTEEHMYNNEHASPAFDEFLDMLGRRIRLREFPHYKGGLDTKTDSTGLYSVHATFQQYELMFHVSTLLPFTPTNRQQLSRKRHIGNDIVTVIFQEPGAEPFSASAIRSHFQQVFIVVRVHNPNSDNVRYSVAVSRGAKVQPFGPAIPKDATFLKSKDFRDFLLTKVINAENAVHKSSKFVEMAARTRREYIRDLYHNHTTSYGAAEPHAPPKRSNRFSSKRKEDRALPKLFLGQVVKAAISWDVEVEDFDTAETAEVISGPRCLSITGMLVNPDLVAVVANWRRHRWIQSLEIQVFYDHADYVTLRTLEDDDYALREIVERLQQVTKGTESREMVLRRDVNRQFGFRIQHEGIVADVEMYGIAWQAGIRQGSRVVEVGSLALARLGVAAASELLEASNIVRIRVLPPLEDGSPRRGCEDPFCSALLSVQPPRLAVCAPSPERYEKLRRIAEGYDHSSDRISFVTASSSSQSDNVRCIDSMVRETTPAGSCTTAALLKAKSSSNNSASSAPSAYALHRGLSPDRVSISTASRSARELQPHDASAPFSLRAQSVDCLHHSVNLVPDWLEQNCTICGGGTSSAGSDSCACSARRRRMLRHDLSNIVNAADIVAEGFQLNSPSNQMVPLRIKLDASLQQIQLLEEKIFRLSEQLEKEKEEKKALEVEVLELRDQNQRLEELEKTAKLELQQFTQWFYKAIDATSRANDSNF